MLVRDLMSTDVVTVPQEATLQEGAERLLTEDVGSVIVVDEDETPTGIVTESDLIRATYESGRPFAEIDVAQVGHKPVVRTEPDTSISRVADKMADNDVKKVPVMDGLDLVGIVTLTDVVWHLSDIRKEVADLQSARNKWDPHDD